MLLILFYLGISEPILTFQANWMDSITSSWMNQSGDLYLLDGKQKKIFRFDPSGKPLGVWGGDGDGPGEFRNPKSISFNETLNTLWVYDPTKGGFFLFDSNGIYLKRVPTKFGILSSFLLNEQQIISLETKESNYDNDINAILFYENLALKEKRILRTFSSKEHSDRALGTRS